MNQEGAKLLFLVIVLSSWASQFVASDGQRSTRLHTRHSQDRITELISPPEISTGFVHRKPAHQATISYGYPRPEAQISLRPETSLYSDHERRLLLNNVGESYSSTRAGNSTSATMELSNQVIYEGLATAPPPSGDQEYPPSMTDKQAQTDEASNVWWALAFGEEYKRVSGLTKDQYIEYCSNTPLLVSQKQRSLCKSHPKILTIVSRGLRMAVSECQARFATSRWNCSTLSPVHVDASSSNVNQSQVFGEIMARPNRERSFLNAIIAAGLAHAMTKACSNGELPEECGCDKKIRSSSSSAKVEWVACSDDFDYGTRFSREFTDISSDVSEGSIDAIGMINAHNYEVGRRIFKSSQDITCTCNSNSASSTNDPYQVACKKKQCWRHLGPFSEIGDELMKRYEDATLVQLNRDHNKLRPVKRGVRRPKRKDLVFIDGSPDYCEVDTRLGIPGTQNRRCGDPEGDNCSQLCCNRGFRVVEMEIEEDCNCKFIWCCQVRCERCRRYTKEYVCQ